MIQRNITFFLLVWMFIVSYIIITISIRTKSTEINSTGTNSTGTNKTFFAFGPNEQFIFFSIVIDTYSKYYVIILFSFLNSCVRKLNSNIVQPWITLNIQNEDKIKTPNIIFDGFFITNISNLYNWIDWVIYMNLLFAQVDIVVVEIIAEMLILNLSTYYYIFSQLKYEPIDDNEFNIELDEKKNIYSNNGMKYDNV
jgi:hypothetical protein